jgi:predicted Ser/Thr protein kinase
MATTSCPDEAQLLPAALGQPVSAEAQAHLEGCPDCRRRVERLRAAVGALREAPTTISYSGPPHAEASAPPIGDREPAPTGSHPAAIGRYLIVGPLGAGGQALVYRAVHPELPRDLAIKVARRPTMIDGSRLKADAAILCELEHPNLVRIYDLDVHEGRPFIAMEYVRGRNLRQVAEQSRPSPRQAAAWVAAVARAVGLAHRRGVVHQDIKPENILVDEAGCPRLIDFGLARLRHAWSDPGQGPSGGTYAYMAPEQARGEEGLLGPQADIFALGGVLYELLTGRPPFGGDGPLEQWDRARRCDFNREWLEAKGIPRGLERIVLKAMAAAPSGRYATAEELAHELEAFVRRPRRLAWQAGLLLLAAFGATVAVATLIMMNRERVIEPLSVTTAPLTGELTVRVWSEGEGGKRGWTLGTPGAVPVRKGEMIHIEAQVNPPAYVYLLWLDNLGKVSPAYPWQNWDFVKLPPEVRPVTKLHDPPELDRGWPVEGPSGLETIVMLARRTPLPPQTDLAALIGRLPPSPLRDEHEVAVRGFDRGQSVDAIDIGLHRGPARESRRIDEPLLQLLEKLRPRFEVIRAVRFAYQGD